MAPVEHWRNCCPPGASISSAICPLWACRHAGGKGRRLPAAGPLVPSAAYAASGMPAIRQQQLPPPTHRRSRPDHGRRIVPTGRGLTGRHPRPPCPMPHGGDRNHQSNPVTPGGVQAAPPVMRSWGTAQMHPASTAGTSPGCDQRWRVPSCTVSPGRSVTVTQCRGYRRHPSVTHKHRLADGLMTGCHSPHVHPFPSFVQIA